MEITDKYINPFTDFGFKKLFGTEPNKDLLIDFLNQLLLGERQISNLSYKNPNALGTGPSDRQAIFDLYCTNEKGERFIIELQKARQAFFKDRSLYYSTFPIREQAKKGEWNFELKAVYTIGILDFLFDNKYNNEFKHTVKLIETSRNEVFYDKLTFIYLEMPKFTKKINELENRFEKWLYVLKNLPKFQKRPNLLEDRIFKKLFKIAELATLNEEEMYEYQQSLKEYQGIKNALETAFQDGFQDGADDKTRLMVRRMIQKGLELTLIAQISELSIEEVKKIAAEIEDA
jgi:predicted transposase/invertase (TIGR01784 family)